MKVKLDGARTATITVRGGELTVRTNPPLSVLADLQSNVGDRVRPALAAIVLAHPFVLEDDTPASVGDFDGELIGEIVKAWGEAVKALPPGSGTPS